MSAPVNELMEAASLEGQHEGVENMVTLAEANKPAESLHTELVSEGSLLAPVDESTDISSPEGQATVAAHVAKETAAEAVDSFEEAQLAQPCHAEAIVLSVVAPVAEEPAAEAAASFEEAQQAHPCDAE
eukprot:8656194-Prorocentrum_lima.AAC.1